MKLIMNAVGRNYFRDRKHPYPITVEVDPKHVVQIAHGYHKSSGGKYGVFYSIDGKSVRRKFNNHEEPWISLYFYSTDFTEEFEQL